MEKVKEIIEEVAFDEYQTINMLFIDRNEDEVETALEAFKKSSFYNDAFVVTSTVDAFRYLNKEEPYSSDLLIRPNIILYDISTDGEHGLHKLQHLKCNRFGKYIPIVVMTDNTDRDHIRLCYKFGAAGCIRKPHNKKEFDRIVLGFNYYWSAVNILA